MLTMAEKFLFPCRRKGKLRHSVDCVAGLPHLTQHFALLPPGKPPVRAVSLDPYTCMMWEFSHCLQSWGIFCIDSCYLLLGQYQCWSYSWQQVHLPLVSCSSWTHKKHVVSKKRTCIMDVLNIAGLGKYGWLIRARNRRKRLWILRLGNRSWWELEGRHGASCKQNIRNRKIKWILAIERQHQMWPHSYTDIVTIIYLFIWIIKLIVLHDRGADKPLVL
jgi:hypothetical protein